MQKTSIPTARQIGSEFAPETGEREELPAVAPTEDQALLLRYATTGDQQAFDEFVGRNGGRIHSWAIKHLGQDHPDVPDLFQETVLKFMREAKRKVITAPVALLHKVFRHTMLNSFRRNGRHRSFIQKVATYGGRSNDSTESDPLGTVTKMEQVNLLHAALDQLSERERGVLLMRLVDGLSIKNIAEQLNETPRQVQYCFNQAQKKLGRLLKKHGMTFGAAILVAAFEAEARAAVPENLSRATREACQLLNTGQTEELVARELVNEAVLTRVLSSSQLGEFAMAAATHSAPTKLLTVPVWSTLATCAICLGGIGLTYQLGWLGAGAANQQAPNQPAVNAPAVNAPAVVAAKSYAMNLTKKSLCAEHDMVNFPIYGAVKQYELSATNPTYPYTVDVTNPNFANCPPAPPPNPNAPAPPPDAKLFDDDGVTVVKTFGEKQWWRARTMKVSAKQPNGTWKSAMAHRVDIHQKIADAASWPVVFSAYQDGNTRFKPHPKPGKSDNVFGFSAIIGPAAVSDRPYCDIQEILIDPKLKTITIKYPSGAPATVSYRVDRSRALLNVQCDSNGMLPYLTFRSMYVADNNCDTARVRFGTSDENVLDRLNKTDKRLVGTNFFFYRKTPSTMHNTSAPDLNVRVVAFK